MKLRRTLARLGLVIGTAAAIAIGGATAASAHVTTGGGNPQKPGCSQSCQTYTDASGKLDCKTCAGVNPRERKITGYKVTLALTVTRGGLNPADKTVVVTDGRGHWANLSRVGTSNTFTGETTFQPTAYYGLSVTKGACVTVKLTCTPYVQVTGGVNCNCKVNVKATYEVSLTFTLTGGTIQPSEKTVVVKNGPNWTLLWRVGTSNTFVSKTVTVGWVPNEYALNISNGTSKVVVKATCTELKPPCSKSPACLS